MTVLTRDARLEVPDLLKMDWRCVLTVLGETPRESAIIATVSSFSAACRTLISAGVRAYRRAAASTPDAVTGSARRTNSAACADRPTLSKADFVCDCCRSGIRQPSH